MPAETPLPAAVRQRVVAWAAAAVGTVPADELPASLRQVARFAPTRRARAGAAPLAAALANDPLVRQRVASWVREQHPDLSAAVESGTPPPAAPPADVGAAAYVLRPDGWEAMLADAGDQLSGADADAERMASERARDEARGQVEALREQVRRLEEQARLEAERVKVEVAQLRRRLREAEADLGRARAAESDARREAEAARSSADADTGRAAAEARATKARLAELEEALDDARRAGRTARVEADARLRLLVDTVVEAAQGLRQELALPPALLRPADAVADENAASRAASTGEGPSRGLAADDPAVLDALLGLPRVHLVVDGYNVTKSGYGELTLEQQRARLLSGLAALAARTRAEVTCVFDGTTLDGPVPSPTVRGVRVIFSAQGTTADEVVRRLVRAEPVGRPVVVVSSDKEVADGVARSGARPVPSAALLRRLDRG